MSDGLHAAAIRPVGVAGLLRLQPSVERAALPQHSDQTLADAYADGVHDGEAAAVAAAQANAESLAAAHATALAAAAAAQRWLADSVADSLADLALAIARAVLAAEPLVRPETIRSLVAEALAAAPAEAGGSIRVAPAACAAVQDMVDGTAAGWSVVVDPAIDPGSVTLVIGPAAIAASLDRRLAQLTTLMAEAE